MANELDVNNVAFIDSVDDAHSNDAGRSHNIIIASEQDDNSINQELKCNTFECNEKQSTGAVWTIEATLLLLKTYESKLEILETPKKKTRIWIAIAENLKQHNIEVTPDQVRWKINALAKKYKQCIDSGEHDKFRFFKDMDYIYSKYNVECTDFSIIHAERLNRKRRNMLKSPTNNLLTKQESETLIELRKIRLANRIEADRSQSKINLEKQWIEYLKRQESQKKRRGKIFERNLKLKEEELRLKKQELQMKEALELRKIELKEKDQEEMLLIEREKCELLKRIFSQANEN